MSNGIAAPVIAGLAVGIAFVLIFASHFYPSFEAATYDNRFYDAQVGDGLIAVYRN